MNEQHLREGCRRLVLMKFDTGVVACSPASVQRLLKTAGPPAGTSPVPTKKGAGFIQPLPAHEHCHVDVSRSTVLQRARDRCLR